MHNKLQSLKLFRLLFGQVSNMDMEEYTLLATQVDDFSKFCLTDIHLWRHQTYTFPALLLTPFK